MCSFESGLGYHTCAPGVLDLGCWSMEGSELLDAILISVFSPSPQIFRKSECFSILWLWLCLGFSFSVFRHPHKRGNCFSFDSRNAEHPTSGFLVASLWTAQQANLNYLVVMCVDTRPSSHHQQIQKPFPVLLLFRGLWAWLEEMFARPVAWYMKSWEMSRRLEKEGPAERHQGTYRIWIGEWGVLNKVTFEVPSY